MTVPGSGVPCRREGLLLAGASGPSQRLAVERKAGHRRWRAWHRWTTLGIAAHAFRAAAAAASTTTPHGLIPITVNELRRLFHALIIEPTRRVGDIIG